MSEFPEPDPNKIAAHRAGRFVLAQADQDDAAAGAVLAELTGDGRATVAFVAELAAISIGLASEHVGPRWRSVLGNALLDLELGDDTPTNE